MDKLSAQIWEWRGPALGGVWLCSAGRILPAADHQRFDPDGIKQFICERGDLMSTRNSMPLEDLHSGGGQI